MAEQSGRSGKKRTGKSSGGTRRRRSQSPRTTAARKKASSRRKLTELRTPPSHLTEIDWLSYEYAVAAATLEDLLLAVDELRRDERRKVVHQTRVVFRRWFSIWKVLRTDGWQSRKYRKGLGAEIKSCYRSLGGRSGLGCLSQAGHEAVFAG